jgi:uncharacterized protein (DUF1810 family)
VDDPYRLNRFIEAQNPVYEQVCAELRNGRKQGHWMWFIFPQLRGLGTSPTAARFGISSREEAQAYLNHPVLGKRLKECTVLVNEVKGHSAEQIFGYPDVLKFKSSMTLFVNVASDKQIFHDAWQKYFEGHADLLTLDRL